MSTLLVIGLKNAILVIPLALIAWAVGRYFRRPALSHLLWTVVLLKLLMPPLVHVPVGWSLGIERWFATAPEAIPAKITAANHSSRSNLTGVRSGKHRSTESGNLKTPSGVVGSRVIESRPDGSQRVTPSATRQSQFVSVGTVVSQYGNRMGGLLWQAKFQLILGIWFCGSIWILMKLVRKSRQFHRYLQVAERRHETLGARAAELAAQAGITIAPRVVVVEGCLSPMLWGMGRRACLVFPVRLISRLSRAELDSLLLHELAHFARGDHWVRVLELFVGVFYWWHPVFWWARSELETAEEQCCDAWVVEHQNGTRYSYAEALLSTIDFLHEPATVLPPVACGLGEVPFLKMRLTQIMRGEVAARLPHSVTALILFAGILCSPLEPALWATPSHRHNASITKPIRTENIPVAPSNLNPNPKLTPELSPSALGQALAPSSLAVNASETRTLVNRKSLNPLKSVNPLANIWAVAHSPNNKYRIEVRAGHQTTLIRSQPAFRLDLTADQITCVSFAVDGNTFATGHQDSIVRRWDCQTGGVLQSYKGCDSPITSTHLSPDGKYLAAGTESGKVVVWDVGSGDEVSHLEHSGVAVSCVRWSPRGDKLAISLGGWSEQELPRVIVRSISEDAILHEQSCQNPIGTLEWQTQDDSLRIATWDGQLQVWDFNSGTLSSEGQIDKDRVSAAAWCADCSIPMTAD